MPLPPRIERICNIYRKAWRGGQPQRIEEVLASSGPFDREDLLVQLIVTDAELRSETGDLASAEEYERRFPMDRLSVVRGMSVISKRLSQVVSDETKPFTEDSSRRAEPAVKPESASAIPEAMLAPLKGMKEYEGYE